jgi:hypothetical protein
MSDEYSLAIGAMIARVAALCQLVRFRLTFEVSARDIVKQHLVLDRKQLAGPPGQMCFNGRLVLEQMIESTIEKRSLLISSSPTCNRSQSAVRRYQSSAMCSSLAGSHSQAATKIAAIFSHATRLRKVGLARW